MKLSICETSWHMGCLGGQHSLCCVEGLCRLKRARLVQTCPCCLSEVAPQLKSTLVSPWEWQYCRAREQTALWENKVPVLSLLPCPLLFRSHCSEKLCWRQKMRPHHFFFFLSGLHICVFQVLPCLIRGGPCSLTSFCWHCHFFLKHFMCILTRKRKLD